MAKGDEVVAAVIENDEYKPMGGVVCDFTKASRKVMKRFVRLQRDQSQAQADISQARVVKVSRQNGDATQQQQYEFMKMQAEADAMIAGAMAVLDAGEDQANELFAVVVKQIDRGHLAPDAPDKLDWGSPESFEWLLDTSYSRLLEEIMFQRQEAVKKTRH